MPTIHFETDLFAVGSWTILGLPQSASAKLPSRGQTMVKGTINGFALRTPLEPDGKGSHWFRVGKTMLKAANAAVGHTVALSIEPIKEWIEPDVPADFENALAADTEVHSLWRHITRLARWEWIRWIRATNQSQTRKKRIQVACSKLKAGQHRPCCWNRNLCTEPYVSKNRVLRQNEDGDHCAPSRAYASF